MMKKVPNKNVVGFTLLLLLAFVSVIDYTSAAVIVETECGPVSGYIDDNGIANFLGIPYAAPPSGDRRWRRPIDLKDINMCWRGIYDATRYGAQCVQYDLILQIIDGSEDCLFVNIWTPFTNGSQQTNLPVMVFIHGGSLVQGSGNTYGMTPSKMAQSGVVSVSFNYRLSVLGFLALKELSASDPMKLSGNYGFFDQILALKWVQKNIAAFGGNPNSVTIWGQSSGGTAVLAMMVSPLAKGLFHKVISMSASPRNGESLSTVEQINANLYIPRTPCRNHTDLLSCLYSLSATSLIAATNDLWNPQWLFGIPKVNDTIVPFVTVDGYMFTKNFTQSFVDGNFNQVPIILGTMHDEVDLMPQDTVIDYTQADYLSLLQRKFAPLNIKNISNILALYPLSQFYSFQQHYDSMLADFHASCGNLDIALSISNYQSSTADLPVYFYINNQLPGVRQCLFDFPAYCSRYSFHILDLFSMNDALIPMVNSDVIFGNMARQIFTQFAATGRVTSSPWVPFVSPTSAAAGSYQVVLFSLNSTKISNYKKDQCSLWKMYNLNIYQWQN